MPTTPRNITDALATFDDLWQPRSLAVLNDTEVRLAKVRGEHVWHRHVDSDEFFLVVQGHLRLSLRDGGEDEQEERHVDLLEGDTFLVPRGVEHLPSSPDGASIVVLDRVGTDTTGDFAGAVPDHITSTTAGLPLD